MAIVIEQSEADIRLAFEVHRHAEIVRVRLASASLRSEELPDNPDGKIGLSFQFKARQVPAPPSTLRLRVTFHMAGFAGLEGAKPGRKAKPDIFVECDYEADYLLQPELELTAEHARAFQEGNAIFNLWPYFREFLQSHVVAMALPPLTAPFLRLQPKPGAPEGPARKKRKPS